MRQAARRTSASGVRKGQSAKDMKTIGQKCGWVISRKERHVIKLLRVHTCESELEFVTKSASVPRRKPVKIRVEFAREELSAFEPTLRIIAPTDIAAG